VLTAGVLPAGNGPAIPTSAPLTTDTKGTAISIIEVIIRTITIILVSFVFSALLIEISIIYSSFHFFKVQKWAL
jgi:hypothetical protein